MIPDFVPARWTLPGTPVGGDLQTIAAISDRRRLPPDRMVRVDVGTDRSTPIADHSDADQIALHINDPPSQTNVDGRPIGNVLLLHGITGCHAAPYMKLIACRLLRLGYRTFRIDARGCGVMRGSARTITHAARSDDVSAAIEHIASTHDGPIAAIGMSLGGNQLLRMLGRIATGQTAAGHVVDRLVAAAAVAPPADLQVCSANMQRRRNRIYNRYFIRALLRRMPPVAQRSRAVAAAIARGIPKTLRSFDNAITAPLAGYDNVDAYYDDASSAPMLTKIHLPTLIVAAQDDPIIPVSTFQSLPPLTESPPAPGVQTLITRHGGHAGYIGPPKTTWLADTLASWTHRQSLSHCRSLSPKDELQPPSATKHPRPSAQVNRTGA